MADDDSKFYIAANFFRSKYLRQFDEPCHGPFTSSIWPAVRSAYMNLLEEIIWIVGTDSDVKLWTNNWVGYPLNSKINIPLGLQVKAKVRDFRLQEKCVSSGSLSKTFSRYCAGH